jgi:hypothetical protein
MTRLHKITLAWAVVLTAVFTSAWVIKDTANPVEIYTGSNTTPTISGATSGAVTLGPSGYTGAHTINGKLTVSQLTTCSGADICAGNAAVTVSNETNNASAATCNSVYFMKVGPTVTASVRCNFQPSSGVISASFRMTIPIGGGNFSAVPKGSGTCGVDDASGNASRHWSVEASAGEQKMVVYNSRPDFTASRGLTCHYTYEVP